MNIQHLTDQAVWNSFFESVGAPSFHHSWEWGLFQEASGKEILRLGLFDDNALVAIALVVKIRSKRGAYLFVPHGPLFAIKTHKLTQTVPETDRDRIQIHLKAITDYLTDLAKKEGFWFIRIAPPLARDDDHKQLFLNLGYRTAPIYVHAESMSVLDVTQSEEELLAGMRKNTRYSIRRAQKDGLQVTQHQVVDAADDFLSLYHKTAKREQFQPYSDHSIRSEFEAFDTVSNAVFFISGFHNNPNETIPPEFAQEGLSKKLAASLVIFTSSCGFYHQGASVHTHYPAAYLLQWHSIMEAKRRGCTYYSFHGVFDKGRTPRAWEGLSLFKRGFGGFEVNYLYTQDLIISPKYYFSFLLDSYLNLKRGV
ncbi:MAG: peptidoglycan bridge formation glycyltransferase FemA/FemB family protein [bacterium]|nr:peptidoglycan bridge formation glycyltransferase FemA/FemB family protein [bacterium]